MRAARAILAPARRLALAASALAVAATLLALGSAYGHPDRRSLAPIAVAAATLTVNDRAKLHVVGGDDNTLVEEGRASGTLPGSARVTLDINTGTASATSSFTFHVSNGSISGHGSAKLHTGSGGFESFGGAATIRGGTGRYAHISGSGGFYGVLDLRDNNAEVQVIGNLHL